ncbi:MAG: hypothetical protein WBA16_10135 [Nonlabens sp.]
MEIKYLKEYQDYIPAINARKFVSEGLPESRITEIEIALNGGNPLPQAFREYLFLGGAWNNIGMDSPEYGRYEGFNEYWKKKMAARGLMPERPIILYALWEEVGTFIYLDEGDDPQPWNFSLDDDYNDDIIVRDANGNIISEREVKIWKQPYKSFSDAVNKKAYRAANGLPTA